MKIASEVHEEAENVFPDSEHNFELTISMASDLLKFPLYLC